MTTRLEAPLRTLMGPGPLDIHPRVYRALGSPVIGHLDPAYLEVLDRIREILRTVFRTRNPLTQATPGTGTSGMEASVANLLEPDDPVLVCVHGYFGDRIRQMAERQDARVTVVEGEWGRPTDPDAIEAALKQARFKLMTVVHAETSTGVLQPMDDVTRLAREHGVMVLLDCVTSLGGVDVSIDEWGIDAAYSCSQKCIGSPPGLAPVTFSARAVETMRKRKHPARSWYLDAQLLDQYWTGRAYHHTSSSTLNYGLLEALLLIEEEGLEQRIARHLRNHRALVAGVEAMGLEMFVAPEHRLPSLNTIRIPDGVNDARTRGYLLETFNLEIGGGLGALKGKVFRVGLMGYSSSPERILFFLSCISQALAVEGYSTDLKAGLAAAMSALD
ncbi:MAG TPA: aminotransferase class V-fold PLP-dependent enzyme [Vicinamibacteria bacterium]|nr:aminotransferase class V-fold PLP-dependent enzyme [Vicinamibacteria bacterium]